MALRLDPETGLLPNPPLLHPATFAEVETVFVREALPARRLIWEHFKEHMTELGTLFPAIMVEVWIDGGFATAKEQPPRDVDFVVLVPAHALDVLSDDARERFLSLFNRRGADGTLMRPRIPMCDAYVIPLYPEGCLEHDTITAPLREYWGDLFGHQRPEEGGRAKGIVQATMAGGGDDE